jgi:hypothetical protein
MIPLLFLKEWRLIVMMFDSKLDRFCALFSVTFPVSRIFIAHLHWNHCTVAKLSPFSILYNQPAPDIHIRKFSGEPRISRMAQGTLQAVSMLLFGNLQLEQVTSTEFLPVEAIKEAFFTNHF